MEYNNQWVLRVRDENDSSILNIYTFPLEVQRDKIYTNSIILHLCADPTNRTKLSGSASGRVYANQPN